MVCESNFFAFITFDRFSVGNNFDFWGDQPSSPKRRRDTSRDKEDNESTKRSPHYDPFGENDNRDSLEGCSASASSSGVDTSLELSNGKVRDMKVTINIEVTTFSELIKCCPPLWTGGLVLKNSGFATRSVFCAGDSKLVELMRDQGGDQSLLRITQRLRLEQSKLNDLKSRVNFSTDYLIMIAVQANNYQFNSTPNSNGGGGEGTTNAPTQQRSLKNLVTYLKTKEAAGVILLDSNPAAAAGAASSSSPSNNDNDQQQQKTAEGEITAGETSNPSPKYVLYLFPPHPFSLALIARKVAPNINREVASTEDCLVGVLVRN